MDADVPYELAVGDDGASLVEIPIHWSLDDWEQYCFIPGVSEGDIESPTKVRELWGLELQALRDESGCSSASPTTRSSPGELRGRRRSRRSSSRRSATATSG